MTPPNDPFNPDSDPRTSELIFDPDEWPGAPAPPAPPGLPAYAAANQPDPLPAIVEDDTACRRCAYNLRGLAGDGQCPECGSPIALSLHGNLLRNCDPGWLSALQRGARLIVLGACLLICALVILFVLEYSRSAMGNPDLRAIFHAIQAAIAASFAIGFVGSWLLTQADPSGTGEDLYGVTRKFTRITTLFGVIGLLLRLSTFLELYPPDTWIYFRVAMAIVAVSGSIGWAAQLRYVQAIALRIPDDGLSRRARFLMFWLTVTWSLLLLTGAALQLTAPSRQSELITAFGCFALVVGIPFIIFYIMNVAMMSRFARHLGELRDLAREAWSGHKV